MMLLKLTILVTVLVASETAYFTCTDVVEKMSDCGDLRVTQGYVPHRDLRIMYTIYEDVQNSDPTQLPMILLHGGPGFPSYYMESLQQMACRGRKIIRYDQGGVDGSKIEGSVADNAPYLFDIDYYPGELEAVVKHLGIDKFHLFGHSWGTVVAQEYAMLSPKNLQSLTLVGAISDGRYYIDQQRLTRHTTLPPYLQKLIRKFEETEDWSSPLYNALNMHLTGLWTLRTMPMPECLEYAFENFNAEVYVAINGPSEFTMSDKLLNWNVTGKITEHYPTIVIGGDHDTMTYEVLKRVADGIAGSRLEIIPHAGHICYVDQPDYFMDLLHDFLVQHDPKNEKNEL